jgi:hypothetical protein
MDKQKIIVVLLLITIVFSIASIILTVGVNYKNLGSTKIIQYATPNQGSASLTIIPQQTGGNSP